ncbi:uncharacterized protein LOC101845577 [Aplysia californica]|uniref:protein-serine/threonine phosphatase n=1 Tax=Aplysia californica TaxID=6500 RepID=A0ABM0K4Y9_APLCA|nr:uncharacterized protein LOC101845577 [Aplysia californica]XP_005108874.1 uncharacterized protein LOC101845577 [Aplysia californica]XP_012943772.1 uncharacterized protein LOC101845577 [Aplysia californica]XP_012943775.1 uncharacterized protein LOC101845577 [Aplysia californica]XP_035828411.1 uncharacterized protein LOC101845577 [Aplysia californica]
MMSIFDEDRPCSVQELQDILTAPSHGMAMMPSTAFDEVYEGIFIGEGDSAKRIGCMKRLRVTHVLNAALGKTAFHVNTNHVMYQRSNIQFLGIPATDMMNYDLSQHFQQAAEFIEAGLSCHGKVFVHCVQGVSRSATLVLAYLMIKRHMTAQDATRLVRSEREIFPNPGFLQQLCDLHEKLKRDGHFQHGWINRRNPGGAEESVARCRSPGVVDSKSAHCLESETPGRQEEDCHWGVCTVEDLEEILTEPSGGFMMLPNEPYHQIDEFIYIGSRAFAMRITELKKLGVTHILNAAQGKGCSTDASMYEPEGLQFLGVQATDASGFDISQYFTCAADYIASAVAHRGKVFVHCVEGVSRSATLVLAYYMIKQRKPVREAVCLVRSQREICPNSSFLQQLCDLDQQLSTTHPSLK